MNDYVFEVMGSNVKVTENFGKNVLL